MIQLGFAIACLFCVLTHATAQKVVVEGSGNRNGGGGSTTSYECGTLHGQCISVCNSDAPEAYGCGGGCEVAHSQCKTGDKIDAQENHPFLGEKRGVWYLGMMTNKDPAKQINAIVTPNQYANQYLKLRPVNIPKIDTETFEQMWRRWGLWTAQPLNTLPRYPRDPGVTPPTSGKPAAKPAIKPKIADDNGGQIGG